MVKVHGTYEYDDDDLTPGKKKEGGLHQNLYDSEGKLKGNASFIPDEEQPDDDDESSVGDDPDHEDQLTYEAEAEERRRELERQENAELIATLVAVSAVLAYVKLKPHVQRLWHAKVSPAVQARREARGLRKNERQERRQSKRTTGQSDSNELPAVVETEEAEGTVVEPSNDLVTASQEYRRNMSSSEAQARYQRTMALMALAARAFSDEQLLLLANANIVEEGRFGELEHTLAELPPAQVAQLIHHLELNPSALADGGFDLTGLLDELAEQPIVEERRDD